MRNFLSPEMKRNSMCGISGLFSHDSLSESDIKLVKSSVQKISHRGPDGVGYINNSNAIMGMCRLAITDVRGGVQPNTDEHGYVSSVFNGEIYNYKELRSKLLNKGYKLKTLGDSECIPLLFLEYGIRFVEYIEGMFAIALWDKRSKTGYLFRDRFGEKPLWYSISESKLLFSSEVKGLMSLGASKDVELGKIVEFLNFGYLPFANSIYQGVNQVTPGSFVTFTSSGIVEKSFWNFDAPALEQPDTKDLLNHSKSLLLDSVAARIPKEREFGIYLSGGIDSALILALTSQLHSGTIRTFTVGFEENEFDESSRANCIANRFGTNHKSILCSPDSTTVYELMSKNLDQPFADSSIIPATLLNRAAGEDVSVVLGGDGGDEVFGGYDRYRASHIIDKLGSLEKATPYKLISKLSSNEKFLRFIRGRTSNPIDRYLAFNMNFENSELSQLVDRELVEMSRSPSPPSHGNHSNLVSQLQSLDMSTYLPFDLMYKSDIASMAYGVEVRSPFLDTTVVRWGLSLPTEEKLNFFKNKLILRKMLSEFLPRDLTNRQKQGFGIPIDLWLRTKFQSLIKDVLLDGASRNRGWLNLNNVEILIDEHMEGRNLSRKIWPLFCLELWAKNWLDSSQN